MADQEQLAVAAQHLNIILNVAQLASVIVGGVIAVILTMQRLAEIRDAIKALNGRLGKTEQRISRVEGKIGVEDQQR